MDIHDFDYDLPQERIAQTAVEPRDAARMLVIHRSDGRLGLEHRIFRDLPEYLRPGDVLVLNQTRVIPARLRASKIPTGGAAEILLIQRIDDRRWLTMIGGKNIQQGSRLAIHADNIDDSAATVPVPDIEAIVVEVREESQRVVEFNVPIEPYLSLLGQLPLPPYIHTPLADPERYQTVYAHTPGSVAAPTAGLHFTGDLLLRIQRMGARLAYCTLHVGPGTFQTVKTEQIEAHRLHEEYAELSAEDAKIVNETKLSGGRVIAVGTTTVRTLETAALRSAGEAGLDSCPWRPVVAFAAPTSLFITPGYRFRVVDAMITNFHLPRSTLLMLVSAFAGRETILNAYEVAKRESYRFYSLGDATLIVD